MKVLYVPVYFTTVSDNNRSTPMNFVPLAVELFGDTGIEPITSASIQADVNGCQQPVGWFDRLDPQWNTTQCVLDKVKHKI